MLDDPAGAGKRPGIDRYGAEIFAGQRDRRKSETGRQLRQDGAAGGGVDQGRRHTAMHAPHRVVLALGRLAGEGCLAVADGLEDEGERPRDRRLRQPAVRDHGHHLEAGTIRRRADGGAGIAPFDKMLTLGQGRGLAARWGGLADRNDHESALGAAEFPAFAVEHRSVRHNDLPAGFDGAAFAENRTRIGGQWAQKIDIEAHRPGGEALIGPGLGRNAGGRIEKDGVDAAMDPADRIEHVRAGIALEPAIAALYIGQAHVHDRIHRQSGDIAAGHGAEIAQAAMLPAPVGERAGVGPAQPAGIADIQRSVGHIGYGYRGKESATARREAGGGPMLLRSK